MSWAMALSLTGVLASVAGLVVFNRRSHLLRARTGKRGTLLHRILHEGFEGGEGTPVEALGDAALVDAGRAFAFVGATKDEAGVSPGEFPNCAPDYQQVFRYVSCATEACSVPVFFEGPHPTIGGARAGVLVVGGDYPGGMPDGYPPEEVRELLPERTDALWQVIPFEELAGDERVSGPQVMWLVPVDAFGRVLEPDEGDLLCFVVGSEGFDEGRAALVDRAYVPLLECALFGVCLLSAFAGGVVTDLRPTSVPRGRGGLLRPDEPYGAGGYELGGEPVLRVLRVLGRAEQQGPGWAMRRCRGWFFGSTIRWRER